MKKRKYRFEYTNDYTKLLDIIDEDINYREALELFMFGHSDKSLIIFRRGNDKTIVKNDIKTVGDCKKVLDMIEKNGDRIEIEWNGEIGVTHDLLIELGEYYEEDE